MDQFQWPWQHSPFLSRPGHNLFQPATEKGISLRQAKRKQKVEMKELRIHLNKSSIPSALIKEFRDITNMHLCVHYSVPYIYTGFICLSSWLWLIFQNLTKMTHQNFFCFCKIYSLSAQKTFQHFLLCFTRVYKAYHFQALLVSTFLQ